MKVDSAECPAYAEPIRKRKNKYRVGDEVLVMLNFADGTYNVPAEIEKVVNSTTYYVGINEVSIPVSKDEIVCLR